MKRVNLALACLLIFAANHAWAQETATCIQGGTTQEPGRPYKTGTGYWDQGTSGSCHAISLINSNIELLGQGCDTGGKLYRSIIDCMYAKGYTTNMLTGYNVPSAADDALKDCKETSALSVCSVTVDCKPYAPNPGYPWGSGVPGGFMDPPSTGGKSPCDLISETLNPPPPPAGSPPPKKGAVQGHFQGKDANGNPVGHTTGIMEIDCPNGKIKVRDPNSPNDPETYDIDKDGKLSNGDKNHMMDGWQMQSSTTEVLQ